MTQTVIGAALGVLLAEGLLQGMKIVWVRVRRDSIRELFSPERLGLPDGFVRYAGAVGVAAAVVIFGVWRVADYLAARSAAASARETEVEAAVAAALPEPRVSADKPAEPDAASKAESSTGVAAGAADPYSDSEFVVHRRVQRGRAANLKDALLRQSEERAGADLLKQTEERGQRSQYDCEAAVHAARYLKAGLDVWGFASWQLKYFPMDAYKGATLPECKSIKYLIDPKRVNVKSAVADRSNM